MFMPLYGTVTPCHWVLSSVRSVSLAEIGLKGLQGLAQAALQTSVACSLVSLHLLGQAHPT